MVILTTKRYKNNNGTPTHIIHISPRKKSSDFSLNRSSGYGRGVFVQPEDTIDLRSYSRVYRKDVRKMTPEQRKNMRTKQQKKIGHKTIKVNKQNNPELFEQCIGKRLGDSVTHNGILYQIVRVPH